MSTPSLETRARTPRGGGGAAHGACGSYLVPRTVTRLARVAQPDRLARRAGPLIVGCAVPGAGIAVPGDGRSVARARRRQDDPRGGIRGDGSRRRGRLPG